MRRPRLADVLNKSKVNGMDSRGQPTRVVFQRENWAVVNLLAPEFFLILAHPVYKI